MMTTGLKGRVPATPKGFLKAFLLCSSIGITFYMMYVYNSPKNNTTVVYYVPSDFAGKCYHIYYNHEGEPPLTPEKSEDGYKVVVKFPFDGKLLTSSDDETFPRLGWYKVHAYFIDEESNVIGEMRM